MRIFWLAQANLTLINSHLFISCESRVENLASKSHILLYKYAVRSPDPSLLSIDREGKIESNNVGVNWGGLIDNNLHNQPINRIERGEIKDFPECSALTPDPHISLVFIGLFNRECANFLSESPLNGDLGQ